MNYSHRNQVHRLLQILFLFLSFCSTFAQNESIPKSHSDLPLSARIVGAVLLIPIGLIFCFAGRKFIKFIMFIIGALLGAFIAFIIARSLVDLSTVTGGKYIGIIIGIVIAAILGGIIVVSCFKLGFIILGAYLGLVLAAFIIRAGTIQSNTTQLILTIVLVVIMGIVAFIFSDFIIIVSTSFNGSSLFINGVDMIALTGYNDFMLKIKAGAQLAPSSGKIWGMLVSSILIGLLGCFVQYRTKPRD